MIQQAFSIFVSTVLYSASVAVVCVVTALILEGIKAINE